MAAIHPITTTATTPGPTATTGQIDTVVSVVRAWTLNEQTGKVTLNFHQGRIGTIVKEETVRLTK
jgi:hypothetical protein